MSCATKEYYEHLEELGFYRRGNPTSGVLPARKLLEARTTGGDATTIDRSFKYQAVLDRNKLGVTDIFELAESPCIYFKSLSADPSMEDLRRWHGWAWNHGLARMLWIVTPTQIRIFNAYACPRDDIQDPAISLFEQVGRGLAELRKYQFAKDQIESGEFWTGAKGRRIERQTRIDEQLVKDLELARRELVSTGLAQATANRLLLKTIFVAYLEARSIVPPALFNDLGTRRFEQVLVDPGATRIFFKRMADTFNGDLFPPHWSYPSLPIRSNNCPSVSASCRAPTWRRAKEFSNFLDMISASYQSN